MREDCDPSDDCVHNCCVSSFIAPVFFVVFVLMAQFVLVNVVVAVLMKHLQVGSFSYSKLPMLRGEANQCSNNKSFPFTLPPDVSHHLSSSSTILTSLFLTSFPFYMWSAPFPAPSLFPCLHSPWYSACLCTVSFPRHQCLTIPIKLN